MKSHEITLLGHKINYVSASEGHEKNVVFVHGWLDYHQTWLQTMQHLSDRYNCYALDLPAFGDSDDPKDDRFATVEGYAEIVVAFCKALDLAPCTLVGHSMGGMTALTVALDHPGIVGNLVLVAAAVTGEMGSPLDLVRKAGPGVYRLLLGLVKVVPPLFRRSTRRFYWNAPETHIWEQLRERALKHTTKYQVAAAASIDRTDLTSRLKDIKLPTLIIAGRYDRIIHNGQAEILYNEILSSQFAVIELAGHNPMAENTDKFIDTIATYLDTGQINNAVVFEGATPKTNRVTKVFSPRRFEIDFPLLQRPPRYNIVSVRDNDDNEVARATVWTDRLKDDIWFYKPGGWASCWGKADNVEVGMEVVDTGRVNHWLRLFDTGLRLGKHALRAFGMPYSDISKLEHAPPITDTKFRQDLQEIVEGVVYDLGWHACALAIFNEKENLFPAEFLRVRAGAEWVVEWGEEFLGTRFEGALIRLDDFPNHPAAYCVRDALAGNNGYYFTRSLQELFDYAVPKDGILTWMLQRLVGVNTLANIVMWTEDAHGNRTIVGNMYAGHRNLFLADSDIAAFAGYVRRASLAVQNHQLYKKTEVRAIEAESLAAMAQFGAKMAHRMIGELSAARLEVEMMMMDGGSMSDELVPVRDQLDKVLGLIEGMKKPFRELNEEPVLVADAIEQAIAQANVPDAVSLVRAPELTTLSPVMADDNLVEVFRVLIRNSVEAMTEGGQISMTAQQYDDDFMEVFVEDNGQGIPLDAQDNLFKLLATTKKHGNGIGLWWVRFYLRRIGGDIDLYYSQAGRGTKFRVGLPLTKPYKPTPIQQATELLW